MSALNPHTTTIHHAKRKKVSILTALGNLGAYHRQFDKDNVSQTLLRMLRNRDDTFTCIVVEGKGFMFLGISRG